MAVPNVFRTLQRSLLESSFRTFISRNVQSRIPSKRLYVTHPFLSKQGQINHFRCGIARSRMLCTAGKESETQNDVSIAVMELLDRISAVDQQDTTIGSKDIVFYIRGKIQRLMNTDAEVDIGTVEDLIKEIDEAACFDNDRRALKHTLMRMCLEKEHTEIAWEQFKILFLEDPEFEQRYRDLIFIFNRLTSSGKYNEAVQVMNEFYKNFYDKINNSNQQSLQSVSVTVALDLATNGIDGTPEDMFRIMKCLLPRKFYEDIDIPFQAICDGYAERGDLEGALKAYNLAKASMNRQSFSPFLHTALAESIRQKDREYLDKLIEQSLSDKGVLRTKVSLMFAFAMKNEMSVAMSCAEKIQWDNPTSQITTKILLMRSLKWQQIREFKNIIEFLKGVNQIDVNEMLNEIMQDLTRKVPGKKLRDRFYLLKTECADDEMIMTAINNNLASYF